MKYTLLLAASILAMGSCVSKKKLLEANTKTGEIQLALDKARGSLANCDSSLANANSQLKETTDQLQGKDARAKQLEDQIAELKRNNEQLWTRMSDLSVISKEGSESIKKSMETLNQQGKYIQDLNSSIRMKDSLNMVLVTNLKRSLSDVSDEDVQVEVKKGVVYVSLSDKMLFRSGSALINPQADTVVSKVAKILNDYKQIEILIEGHTDNVPIFTACILDNWDLSVKRAAAVARMLQEKYEVAPQRMIAGGRGEYMPKGSNDSPAERSLNRRTEIIITPKMDQYFNLYTDPDAGK